MDTKDLQQFLDDFSVFDLQGLKHILKRPDIMERLRFDVTPRMIMAPRTGPSADQDISGYTFYIEALNDPPHLMLMKIGRGGITSTVGKIEEIPAELLRHAIDEPPDPPANNMYAITPEIEEWLRKEMGL